MDLPVQWRILIIDDDSGCRDCFGQTFREAGFQTLLAATGCDGLRLAREREPNIILLDLLLPGLDGFLVFRQLRSETKTKDIPVVFITGQREERPLLKSAGIAMGACTLLRKPVAREDLLANIECFLPVTGPVEAKKAGSVLERGRIRADSSSRRVWVRGKLVSEMPAKSFDLLWALLRHEGLVSRGALLAEVWDESHDKQVVNQAIYRLREELGPNAQGAIRAFNGGYMLVG